MGRKIPMWQAVLVMLFLVAVLMYCLGVLGKATGIDALKCSYGEAHIPLIISAVLAGIVAVANGYKWKYVLLIRVWSIRMRNRNLSLQLHGFYRD